MRYQLDLTISERARKSLAASARDDQGRATVPTIVWVTYRETGKSDWMVGAYDGSKIPDEFFVNADGLELVVEPQWREGLKGKQLDFVDGRFVLTQRA